MDAQEHKIDSLFQEMAVPERAQPKVHPPFKPPFRARESSHHSQVLLPLAPQHVSAPVHRPAVSRLAVDDGFTRDVRR